MAKVRFAAVLAVIGAVAAFAIDARSSNHWYSPAILPVFLLSLVAFTIANRKLRPYEETSEQFRARWHREIVEDLEQRKRQRARRRADR